MIDGYTTLHNVHKLHDESNGEKNAYFRFWKGNKHDLSDYSPSGTMHTHLLSAYNVVLAHDTTKAKHKQSNSNYVKL